MFLGKKRPKLNRADRPKLNRATRLKLKCATRPILGAVSAEAFLYISLFWIHFYIKLNGM